MPASDGLAALGRALGAYSPNATPPDTPATRAAQLCEVVGLLRKHDESAAAQHFANALERWLARGGDLGKALGLQPGRTRSAARDAARLDVLRPVLAKLDGPIARQAEALSLMIRCDDPAVAAAAGQRLPRSSRQLVRLLRTAADDT